MPARFPPALSHDDIAPVPPLDGVFFVVGTARFAAGIRVSRTMTILCNRGGLTLVNTVRLKEAGLAALDAIGRVEHIVRLGGAGGGTDGGGAGGGAVHGQDDPFYKDRYPEATVWAMEGVSYANIVKDFTADKPLSPSSLPLPNCRLLIIPSARLPEALLLVEHEKGNFVVSGDPLQNFGKTSNLHFSILGAALLRMAGFMKDHNVGPGFVSYSKCDVRDLAKLLDENDFEHVLPCHGTPVIGDARLKYRPAVEALVLKQSTGRSYRQ